MFFQPLSFSIFSNPSSSKFVTKKSTRQKKKKSGAKQKQPSKTGAWLPTRGGLMAVGVASVLLTIWITFQATKVSSLGESLLWGLGFGGSIWLIFGLVFFVNKFLRNR
jgi:hypothetical protein